MCRGSNRSLSHFGGVFRPDFISAARVGKRFYEQPLADARDSGV